MEASDRSKFDQFPQSQRQISRKSLGGGNWISYADTGTPGTVTPKDVVAFPILPTALFFEYFTLSDSPVLSSLLNVWADDTAGVAVNNHIVKLPNGIQDGACAAGSIGCQPNEGLHMDISQYLRAGENVLTFAVYQRGGGAFGLLYDGQVLSAGLPTETPEPASMGLMGTALAGLGVLLRKRKVAGCYLFHTFRLPANQRGVGRK